MKKFLLFLMFAMFCIPWAANAQETLTVHDGTATNGFVPVYGFYADAYLKCEMVYPAAELGEMDGGTITSMTFYASTPATDSWGSANFQVFLTEVADATISAFVGPGTVVYEGALDGTQSEITITFTTPYVYNGGNLLVGVYNTVEGSYKSITWAGEEVTGASITGYSYNSLDDVTAVQRNFLPKTTFGYTPGEDVGCGKPRQLAVNYTGGTTATVTWTGDATLYNIDVNGTVTNNVTSPYTLSGLELATTYAVKVQANCNSDLSDFTYAVNFTTDLCMPENMCELSYEFEDSFGDGWNGNAIKVVDAATGVEIANLTIASGSSASGTISVCDGRAINFVWVTGSYASETSYTFYDINNEEIFNGSAGSGVITDYVVNCTPATCLKPQNLTYSVSGNEITLNWTSDATLWNVEVNGVATSTSSNPYTFTGELATEYTVRVQADCGHNDVSEWTNAVSFTTDACMPEEQIIVNYTLNDSYGDGWNGNAILVVDENCNIVEQLTIESGASALGTVKVCGSYVQFLWYAGTYPTETSWSFTDNAGNVLFEGAGSADMATLDVLYTIDNNPYSVPTDVAVSEVGPHSAKLSWTETGTATTWQIKLTAGDDEEGTIIDANSNPFVLTGLDSETAYYAQVRATGANGTSVWTCLGVSFTTDVDCPAPTELVVNPFTTSADVTWNGSAESYNIRYRTSESTGSTEGSFFEDFENGTLGDWTAIRGNEGNEYTDWRVVNSETLFSSGAIPAHSGSYVVMGRSWNTSSYAVCNWLISPQVSLDHALSYWVMDDGSYHEHYDVYVSTTTADTSAFTLLYEPGDASSDWTQHTVDLSSYNGQQGYIAFRLQDYDQDYLFIDDVFVGEIVVTVPAGEWVTVTTNDPTVTLSGLNPETEYELQVQSNCGTDGESEVATTTFTTASACDAPNTLAAEVEGTTATLSWNAYQESFNLYYRQQVAADPTAPATIILEAHDTWGDGTGYQMLLDADATAYGVEIPESGPYTGSDYSAFEYLIPENADCESNTENLVFDGSITLEIPAGVYDWCIINPEPGGNMWISGNGDIPGRYDDYVFEAGVTYHFTMQRFGTGDGAALEIIRPMSDWVVVENVTSPYELAELDPATYYEWYVEGINAGCTGDMTSEIANFTTEAPCGIVLNAPNYVWEETFESYNVAHTDGGFTHYLPKCWTLVKEYTGASPDLNNIGLGVDTLPQVFYYPSFDANHDGNQTLRMKFHSLVAMPELDESVDMSRLHLSMWVRQPQTYYHLQVGVLTDLTDDSTFEPLVDIDNESTNMEKFELDFSRYQGEGRYIAFKNVGGSSSNPYCTQYLDDIVLTYNAAPAECGIAELYYKEGFEGYTINPGATGVEPDCWEVIDEISALDFSTKPQLYAGFNTTEGGNYTLRMLNRCVYAMPELSSDIDVNTLTMTFNLRQPKAVYRLQVGVLDADNNFELVEEIDNEITDMVEDVMVNFADYTGNGHRIAFRNVLNGRHYKYSYNYLDDIYIDLTENFDVDPSKSINDLTDGAEEYLNRIAVYPNPTTGMLHIDAVDVQKVECYSQMGQLVGVYDNVNELNISELANGVYTLRITVPQGVTMRKVVKR